MEKKRTERGKNIEREEERREKGKRIGRKERREGEKVTGREGWREKGRGRKRGGER